MIYDITPPISEQLAVWPGDTPPRREVLCAIESGDNITMSDAITIDINVGRW